MIRFEGDRVFAQPPAIVASRLTDAAFLVSALPNVDHVSETSPDRAAWKLRTGFSFLSTTLDVTLTVIERSETAAKYEAISKGVGATSKVEAHLTFQRSDSGTKVHYAAEIVERTGFLKLVSAGLIQAAAKSVIEDTWRGIEAKLNEAV